MDYIWPTSNEFEIPDLVVEKQPVGVDAPLEAWGARARKGSFRGTYHFYVDDYRFSNVWHKPQTVIDPGTLAIVEPNYSVFDQTPYPVVLWHTYRKRWLARWFQERGLGVWVDLNVSETHSEVNLFGVPKGWSRFATRGYDVRIPDLEREYRIAADHAGKQPILIVYGGGARVADACRALPGALHFTDSTSPRKWKREKKTEKQLKLVA